MCFYLDFRSHFEAMVQIASMFSLKYFFLRNSSPKAFLDHQMAGETTSQVFRGFVFVASLSLSNCRHQSYRNIYIQTLCLLNDPRTTWIAPVRYPQILTWIRGFLVIFLYLVWFSLCSSLLWEWRDNEVVKICNFNPYAQEWVMLEF